MRMRTRSFLSLALLTFTLGACSETPTEPRDSAPKELRLNETSFQMGEEGPTVFINGVEHQIYLPESTSVNLDEIAGVCPILEPGYYIVLGSNNSTPAAVLWVKPDCSTQLMALVTQG